MVSKNLFVHVLRTKVASAVEGIKEGKVAKSKQNTSVELPGCWRQGGQGVDSMEI